MVDQLRSIVDQAYAQLRAQGTTIESGLNDTELAGVGEAVGAEVPVDLATMWEIGLPVGESWPAWREDPAGTAADARAFVHHAFAFDIENGYWIDAFGRRPDGLEEAKAVAADVVAGWPPLIRVYGHRFLVTDPSGPGSPVLSVWQAFDSIYYGRDLPDYLTREFLRPAESLGPNGAVTGAQPVPYWGEAFDL
jgi:hypothetical protein